MPLPPGAVIGILGGGQLGRMTAMAAARLGYHCHIFCPEEDSPAAEVARRATVAPYEDETALAGFAAAVDVVTLEFENVPRETVARLAETVPVRPSAEVLAVTQDRLAEKRFLREIGAEPAAFFPVEGPADIAAARERFGGGCIVKSRRFGYDGKGQVAVDGTVPPEEAWRQLGGVPAVAEAVVDFALEISVLTARRADGRTASYEPAANRHEGGILRVSTVPAPIPRSLAAEAVTLAERIAAALDLVGLLAVEMFVTRDGRLLINELAPRPHNSAHWTLDAAETSQFEQHVRAVCGLPLGRTVRHADAVMRNLIGEEVAEAAALLEEPGVRLHLYGKAEVRPGRKMGHVTRLLPLSSG